MEVANPLTVKPIILGLALYYFPVNSLTKKKRSIDCVIRKPRGLKVRRYASSLIGLKKYLDSLPGATLLEKLE